MNWSGIGAALLALAVALGAFGAHGLKDKLDAYSMDIYQKAVFYHFIHAIGILITPLLLKSGSDRVCWLLFAGVLLFSGSLYALAISGVRVLGAITPLGGVSFILAWVLLAYGLFRG